MKQCPKCGDSMVRWGHGRTERWRCPSCSQLRRDSYHDKTLIDPGAPRRQLVEPKVFIEDADLTLYNGDCLEVLSSLPDNSVHMCATSPPFFALRDYGVEGQIGLEETPELWVEKLVEVFREVRRVLRPEGTLWVEIGDSYASSPPGNSRGVGETSGLHGAATSEKYRETLMAGHATKRDTSRLKGVKPKDLIGAPWMLAFALRADGWWLRSEIIWEKPNAMPESVQDRPTRSHSTVFLLSKKAVYFYDIDALREAHESIRWGGPKITQPSTTKYAGADGSAGAAEALSAPGREWNAYPEGGRNARSVWSIPTEPNPMAHFATFPTKLVSRMIQAGTSEKGCCPECGAPWVRDVEIGELVGEDHGGNYRGNKDSADAAGANRFRPAAKEEFRPGMSYERNTRGWLPSCNHQHESVPCVVLDPFVGSGTTLFVARNLGRHSVGIELSTPYCQLVVERTQQLSLLT